MLHSQQKEDRDKESPLPKLRLIENALQQSLLPKPQNNSDQFTKNKQQATPNEFFLPLLAFTNKYFFPTETPHIAKTPVSRHKCYAHSKQQSSNFGIASTEAQIEKYGRPSD